jgi:hypothetical protein
LTAERRHASRRAVIIDHPSLSGINTLSLLGFSNQIVIGKDTRHHRGFRPWELSREFGRRAFGATASFGHCPVAARRSCAGTVPHPLEAASGRATLTSMLGNPGLVRSERSETAR